MQVRLNQQLHFSSKLLLHCNGRWQELRPPTQTAKARELTWGVPQTSGHFETSPLPAFQRPGNTPAGLEKLRVAVRGIPVGGAHVCMGVTPLGFRNNLLETTTILDGINNIPDGTRNTRDGRRDLPDIGRQVQL